MPCGSCSRSALPTPESTPLLQIRFGFRARWYELELSVEKDADEWKISVRDAAGSKSLYAAHRSGVHAAKYAAAEFAIFQIFGAASPLNPDRLSNELRWQPYW
jgi:hypothetical protein